MLEQLSQNLEGVFKKLRGHGKLSEANISGSWHEEVPTGASTTKLEKSIKTLKAHQGLVIRGYGLNTANSWKNAKKIGANMMSTDKVRKNSWAMVDKSPFTKTQGR